MKKIVIIESSPIDFLAKVSYVLKRKGYDVSLVTLLGNTYSDFIKESYNKQISFGFQFFKVNMKNLPAIMYHALKNLFPLVKSFMRFRKLKPDLIIVRTTPNWLYYIVKKYFKEVPIVYFPYDIRSFCYQDNLDMVSSGVPQFEINAERWSFENADGIIHKGQDNELNLLDEKVLGKKIRIKCPAIHLLPSCLKELSVPINKDKLSKKDKEVHVVFVGHIGVEESWRNSVKMVLANKIHLHLYGKTANLAESRGKAYPITGNKYFHLHNPVDQKFLSKEISKYDYGVWLGYYDVHRKNITTATGNKLASYLEAGLPIIYFKNHKCIGSVLKEFNAGVEIKDADSPLKKILRKQKYQKLLGGVEKGRKYLDSNQQIPRLEKFFEEVRKHHYS